MAVRALRVTVVDPALDSSAPMWGDASEGWLEPAMAWLSVLAAAGVPLRAVADPAQDDGEGLLVAPSGGASAVAGRPMITGPPPASAAEALALVTEALGALVRPDLRGTLVLRLDDPGAAVRRYLDGWSHEDVSPRAWDALWAALDGFGRVSLFCCPGWVHPDGTVEDSRTASPDEWAALDVGVGLRLADLECHGWTHMHHDLEAWVSAPDRFASPAWYREFWPPGTAPEPPADQQLARLHLWQRSCGPGTSLVAGGEAWGTQTLAAARSAGFRLFNSWGICRLDLPAPTWSRGIGSPYLDEADPVFLADGLPAVGYWHDRDMALHGPAWVRTQLDAWRDCGATRAIAFADLARAYEPLDAALVDGEVVIRSAPDVPLLVDRPSS